MRLSRLIVAVFIVLTPIARAGLGPGDLLLIVNRNVPESSQLAAHYADARHVPANHVLTLDLPGGDDLSPADYDAKVAAPVRQFLQSPAGQPVRCLVLFYGIPLRVAQRPTPDADRAELTSLRKLSDDLDQRAPALADELEAIAKSLGAAPAAGTGSRPQDVRRRIESAGRQVQDGVLNLIDPAQRQAAEGLLAQFHQHAVAAAAAALAKSGISASTSSQAVFATCVARPRDSASRAAVRGYAAEQIGALALQQVVQNQIVWIDGEESDAAIDSELAMVLAGDYPFYRWQLNPLNIHEPSHTVRALMVSRIDAPSPQIARRIIDDSIAVEAVGLDGRCVIDSRGLPGNTPPGTYGWFDQILRDTATYLKAKTKLDVVADDRAQVLLPGSVRDVALYCGWYSLRQYIASCTFRPGAVAYHVASLELVSMHAPGETGWVPNLLNAGVDATLGAVSEPYLNSFPQPNEFFPLLLTGNMTLAEAYWASCPMTSWKMILIGDPLYKPYAAKPALAAADLPAGLRPAGQKVAATRPAGR